MKQVAGESVASGDPQEGLESFTYHCQAHRAFLVTFRASGEGRKELVGMRRVGGPGLRVEQRTPWELGSTEQKASWVTFEQSALPR